MPKVSAKSPSYIVRQSHSYCFRLVLPSRLRPAFGLTELRYSLRTGSLSEARYRARTIAAYVQRLVRLVDKGALPVVNLTPTQLQDLIRRYALDFLQDSERERLHTAPLSDEEWDNRLETHAMLIGEAQERLAKREYAPGAAGAADWLLEESGLTLDKSSEEYRKLCLEILKATITLEQNALHRHQGHYPQTDSAIIETIMRGIGLPTDAEPLSAAPVPTPQVIEKNPLTDLIDRYVLEKERGKRWSPKTKADYLSGYALFMRFAGASIAVQDITGKLMREYKDALLSLPKNIMRDSKYDGKSIAEIVSMENGTKLDVGTVNKYMARMSSLLKWAEKNQYIQRNPADGMQLSVTKRPEDQRSPFTPSELHALFHSEYYTHDRHEYPYRYWVPILALFTGTRQQELIQLYLDDIYQDNGVWVFSITPSRQKDKKVKTPSSIRLVPLHPFLLELGIVRYANELRGKGESRLFPEAKGHAPTVSRWFNGDGTTKGYRQRCGIETPPRDEPRKDYHSFRHSLINILNQNLVDLRLISQFVGQKCKVAPELTGRYGDRPYSQVVYDKLLPVIDFHLTIPLDHLLHSKYARPEK